MQELTQQPYVLRVQARFAVLVSASTIECEKKFSSQLKFQKYIFIYNRMQKQLCKVRPQYLKAIPCAVLQVDVIPNQWWRGCLGTA